MLNTTLPKKYNSEQRFLQLYHLIQEREKYLNNDAKIIQYSAILRYFTKFLQQNDYYTPPISAILLKVYIKLGHIYYEEGLQTQDNSRFFLAAEYYNQALTFAEKNEDKEHILLTLKDIYYYVNDEDALIKVEETWAENHQKDERFDAYMFLAQNAEKPYIKAKFLEKALDEIMEQNENFYAKYQNTLNISSQLAAIYELQGEKDKTLRIKKLRENTLKLLN